MNDYKTFEDLVFKPYGRTEAEREYFDGLRSKMTFQNGYGISVVRFKMGYKDTWHKFYGSHTSNDDEWEVGILYEGELVDILEENFKYESVIGHQTKEQITEIMKNLQTL